MAGTGFIQEGAVNREENNESGGDIDGDAEDPFQRHVHMPHDALQVITPMVPGGREILSHISIDQKAQDDDGKNPAGRPPYGLQDQGDEDDPHDQVQVSRGNGPVDEIIKVPEHVKDGEKGRKARTQSTRGPLADPALRAGKARIVRNRVSMTKRPRSIWVTMVAVAA